MGEKIQFFDWLGRKYGYGSEIYKAAVRDLGGTNVDFPPKRSLIAGRGWGWGYDWERIYNDWKSPRPGQIELGTETSPWEQLGMTEREFSKSYPEQYKKVQDWVASQEAVPEAETADVMTEARKNAAALGMSLMEYLERTGFLTPLETPKAGEVTEREMFDWQKEQAQRQWGMEQSALATQAQREKWATQKAMSDAWFGQITGAGRQTQAEPDYAGIWESVRSSVLSQLQAEPYRNWVTIWQTENMPNPYRPQTEQPNLTNEEQVQDMGKRIKFFEDQLKDMKDKIKDPASSFYESSEVRNKMDTLKTIVSSLKEKQMGMRAEALPGVYETAQAFGLYPKEFEWRATDFMKSPEAFAGSEMAGALGGYTAAVKGMGFPTSMSMEQLGSMPRQPSLQTPSWMAAFGIPSVVSPRSGQLPTASWSPNPADWGRLSTPEKQQLMGYWERAGKNMPVMTEKLEREKYWQTPQPLRLGRTWRV